MQKTTDIDPQIVDALFKPTTDATEFIPQTKTIYYDKDGNEIGAGIPTDVFTKADYVARVSSMSLSVKVTPKVGNDYLSVERQITLDINTLDKEIIYAIWKDLQEQVVGGTLNTLTMTLKRLNEVKKAV